MKWIGGFREMFLPFILNQTETVIGIDCEFQNKICHFTGNSGNGKTLLFDMLSTYCKLNGIAFILVNYTSEAAGVPAIISSCTGKQMVFLDNADLYDFEKVLDALRDKDCIVLVSYHKLRPINAQDGRYTITWVDNTLRVRRVRSKV